MREVYMDYAASSPVDPRVVEAMMPYLTESYGNPSSLHYMGREAVEALMEARVKIGDLINSEPEEIIFTSGGTESNNLGIKGAARRNKEKGNHIITTDIEHISTWNICKYLKKEGFETTSIPVDGYGVVDVEKLKESITDKTILISVMYANGEVGTIEPIKEIGEIARDKGILFHVDVVAAAGKIPIDVVRDNIDLMSISSNDMYGPKGTGALFMRKGIRILPTIHGGGQEKGIRSGTENIPNIVGMGKAAEIAKKEMTDESKRLTKMRDRLIDGIVNHMKDAFLNGHPKKRLPNNVSVRFRYIEGESLLLDLEMEGVAASTGSACQSKTLLPSRVLTSMGISHEETNGSLQFTLGRFNKEEDVGYVLDVLPSIVKRLRAMSPLVSKKEV
ncbi:MAG: cysteine desulfurase family protein [Candidatus Hydrothermarchaeales archaeon]